MDLNSDSENDIKTFIFTNDEDGKELFRLHVNGLSIKYDEKFEKIINLNTESKELKRL